MDKSDIKIEPVSQIKTGYIHTNINSQPVQNKTNN